MKASKIVKEALTLANLDNTDFISHKEHVNYLNDGFTVIYNDQIDKNNTFWLKEVQVKGSPFNGFIDFPLPKDFYRLRAVYSGTTYKTIIPRKSVSQEASASYEIRNNRLRVYNVGGSVSIEYWPTPTRITFPSSINPEGFNMGNGNSFDNLIFFWKEGVLYKYNYDTQESEPTSLEGEQPIRVGNGVIWTANGIYNYRGELLREGQFVLDNYGVPFEILGNRILTFNGALVLEKEEEIWNVIGFDSDNEVIYQFDGSTLTILKEEKEEIPFDEAIIDFKFIDSKPYILTENNIYNIEDDRLYSTGLLTNYCFYKDKVLGFNGTETVSKGYEEETDLNYPNNIYYRALAAYLAMQYCNKQGVEDGPLKESFLSLSGLLDNDANDSPIRITNVY